MHTAVHAYMLEDQKIVNCGHENDTPKAEISPASCKKQIWNSTSGTGLTVHEIWIGRLQQLWLHRWPCGFGCLSQFSLEKYTSAFLELCQRKGKYSFISLLALSSLHLLSLPNSRFDELHCKGNVFCLHAAELQKHF